MAEAVATPPQVELEAWRRRALALESALSDVILGQAEALRLAVIALFARGHVLLEGDVGVGKTTLLRALSRAVGGAYERLEGTVDLLPGDLVYHAWVDEGGRPRVDPGPVVRHGEALAVLFFNEINRARPQVHSLLLRVMAERSASVFQRDVSLPHVLVFADRNRLEREETFELPAALRDRFLFEILVAAPSERPLQRALMRDTRYHDADALIAAAVPQPLLDYRELESVAAAIQDAVMASDALVDYALELCAAIAAPDPTELGLEDHVGPMVRAGVSPRGMSLLLRAARVESWLQGRPSVLPSDVARVFHAAVAHRLVFTPVLELRRAELASRLTAVVLSDVSAP